MCVEAWQHGDFVIYFSTSFLRNCAYPTRLMGGRRRFTLRSFQTSIQRNLDCTTRNSLGPTVVSMRASGSTGRCTERGRMSRQTAAGMKVNGARAKCMGKAPKYSQRATGMRGSTTMGIGTVRGSSPSRTGTCTWATSGKARFTVLAPTRVPTVACILGSSRTTSWPRPIFSLGFADSWDVGTDSLIAVRVNSLSFCCVFLTLSQYIAWSGSMGAESILVQMEATMASIWIQKNMGMANSPGQMAPPTMASGLTT
jgi:hypothetical protein